MKITKRQLRQIIKEEFNEETKRNFNSTMAQFEENFKASCVAAVTQITKDGNHNNHEVLELLFPIVDRVIDELFETMPL